jgi:hypothetical protein
METELPFNFTCDKCNSNVDVNVGCPCGGLTVGDTTKQIIEITNNEPR